MYVFALSFFFLLTYINIAFLPAPPPSMMTLCHDGGEAQEGCQSLAVGPNYDTGKFSFSPSWQPTMEMITDQGIINASTITYHLSDHHHHLPPTTRRRRQPSLTTMMCPPPLTHTTSQHCTTTATNHWKMMTAITNDGDVSTTTTHTVFDASITQPPIHNLSAGMFFFAFLFYFPN